MSTVMEKSQKLETFLKRGMFWSYTGLAVVSMGNSAFIIADSPPSEWLQGTQAFALCTFLLNAFVIGSLLSGRWKTMLFALIFNLSPVYNFILWNIQLTKLAEKIGMEVSK